MTRASMDALNGLRDFSMMKWYVIPLLAIVFYIYTKEVKLARETGDWNPVFAGLAIFGIDFFNETWNGWVLNITGYSAFWTAPGDTALRTMVGWNIEIMFMFSLLGIIFYHTLTDSRLHRIFRIPEQWFWAIGYSIFCVFIETLLNKGDLLIWAYPFWDRTFAGIWLIFFIGYFHFFVGAIIVINLSSIRSKVIAIGVIYAVPVIMNIIGMGFLGWRY